MTRDEKIAKLAREISDYYATMLRIKSVTPESPEYWGINSALKFTAAKYDQKMADDILDIALTLKKRVPQTFEQIKKKNPQFDDAYLEKPCKLLAKVAW